MLDNYSWNGVIGELSKKYTDIGLVDFSVTEKRSQVVDFTIPLTYDAAKLWQKIPNRSFSWFTFTNVFEKQYWLALGVVTVAIAFLLYLYFLIVAKENSIDIGTSISTVFLSLISFGIPAYPKRTPGRILILTITLIFGAVNFWAFNAGLLSKLMADKFVFPIKSMRDLLEKEDYNLLLSPSMCLKFI